MPVPTYGLTHLALRVPDVERAFRFYAEVFGMVAVYRDPGFIQAQTPGTRDVLVFEKAAVTSDTVDRPGRSGGIAHFGFRLKDPADIAAVSAAITAAGGAIREEGEFVPGEPYVFFTDLDGYLVEVWYELPTPADPP
jgi:catechol 2,3-dioxygenase-like lactoylglutathione lyase family enzyme